MSAPKFCPNCGAALTIVRPILSSFFEVACQSCDDTSVISMHDQVKLPSTKPDRGPAVLRSAASSEPT